MLLSALDFPFCFAAVRWLGVERIGAAEKKVVGFLGEWVPEGVGEGWGTLKGWVRGEGGVASAGEWGEKGGSGGEVQVEGYAVVAGTGGGGEEYDHGVLEAERENGSERASESSFFPRRAGGGKVADWEIPVLGIWTQLALAYAIHKSFIFIRVPFTVAVTPKVVKVLRGWGWDIGKRRPKGIKSTKD